MYLCIWQAGRTAMDLAKQGDHCFVLDELDKAQVCTINSYAFLIYMLQAACTKIVLLIQTRTDSTGTTRSGKPEHAVYA